MTVERVVRAVYRALVRAHPAARRGCGPQMRSTFDALLARAARRGSRAQLWLLVRESAGLLTTMRTGAADRPATGAAIARGVVGPFWQDARYALRTFRRRPAFTAAVVLTLGLGIGATSAIFSLVNALLFNRLPFREPDRLVAVWEDNSARGFPRNTPSPANYADWTRAIPALESVAALDQRDFNLTGQGEPEQVGGAGVTANLFATLGVSPLFGRVWRADEDAPGSRVAVLTYGLWQRRFGGDAHVLDRPVILNGVPYSILGVMPQRFEILSPDIEVLAPIGFSPATWNDRDDHYLWVVGRLAAGQTVANANIQLHDLATRLEREHRDSNDKIGMFAVPLLDDYLGDTKLALLLLGVAVGVVLVIACANVANLLLARAAGRGRETATRAALGASRGRLLRQLLTESVLLAVGGGVLGLGVAALSFSTLSQLVPVPLADMSRVRLDWRVLAATAAASMVTAMLCGLVPALRAARADLNAAGGFGSARGAVPGPTRLAHTFVVVEIALAALLLVGAGLVAESFGTLRGLDLGFKPDHVVALRTQLPRASYAEFDRRVQFVTSVLDEIRTIPGVAFAGYTSGAPLTWKGGTSMFRPEGLPADRLLPYDAVNRVVSQGYMEAAGMTLRAGRFFDNRDDDRGQFVAIVNELMAREYWPGTDVVGRRVRTGAEGATGGWRTIVGVVANTRPLGLEQPPHAELFVPLAQAKTHWMWPRDLAIRFSGDVAPIVAAARAAVHRADPAQPVSKVETLQTLVDVELAGRRTQATLMAAFALLALALAAVGIYGVLSYAVTTRTAEIGVRLALGGHPGRVRALVVARGMTLASLGLAIGAAAALWAAGLIRPLLFHVEPRNPWTVALPIGILALVCLAAVYLPARRASRIDPLAALRSD